MASETKTKDKKAKWKMLFRCKHCKKNFDAKQIRLCFIHSLDKKKAEAMMWICKECIYKNENKKSKA